MPAGGAPGKQIGPFVLETLIGRGPFAEIWRTRHAHLAERSLDLKLYTDGVIIRLLKQADPIPWYRAGRTVPALIAFEPQHDPPHVVTEHVVGQPLDKLLAESGKFDLPRALNVLSHIAGALKSVHHQGLLHLDLKSENVLVSERDEVYLLDLAVGRFSVAAANHYRNRKSAPPEVARSMAYRTRRQKRGGETDERTDIFGMGVLMFEMLTGKLPVGKQIPSMLSPELPRWLDKVFTRCVTRLEKRYPNVLALEKDLRKNKQQPRPAASGRFKTLKVIGPEVVLVSMFEIAGNRDTVDAYNIETIIKNIDYLGQHGYKSIVFDFSNIAYVSSTGFGYLVNLADAITSRGGKAIIYQVQQKVRTILDVLGLSPFFVLCENLAEARSSLEL